MIARANPILLAIAVAAFPLSAAATFIVTDLGTLLGGTFSEGHSINDSGQVVGSSSTSSGASHAFLYSGGDTLKDLGTLGTGTTSNALAINNSGQVAGWSYTSGTTQQRAFLYNDSRMTDLPNLGGSSSVATGIGNTVPGGTPQVVGYRRGSTGGDQAFLYTDGAWFNLGTLDGGQTSRARAINGIGQVVGYTSYADGTTQAFLYSGNTMMPLGFLPGGHSSVAMAINDTGQVAGSGTYSEDYQNHAFLTGAGGLQDLGTLGGSGSTGWGINNAGQVVGSSSRDVVDTTDYAFLYSGGVMTDLSLLEEVRTARWTSLRMAYDINNLGKITGLGLREDGQYHAFLLTPGPEPALEEGDAGGLEHPQAVLNPANGISGTIGGEDTVDAFSFNWLDSSEMKVRFSDPTGELARLYLSLFTLDDMTQLISDKLLTPGEWVSLGWREAANYLLKVTTDSTIDPPFTLDLLGTGTGPAIGPPQVPSVPEPTALSLLAIGLGFMGRGIAQRKKLGL